MLFYTSISRSGFFWQTILKVHWNKNSQLCIPSVKCVYKTLHQQVSRCDVPIKHYTNKFPNPLHIWLSHFVPKYAWQLDSRYAWPYYTPNDTLLPSFLEVQSNLQLMSYHLEHPCVHRGVFANTVYATCYMYSLICCRGGLENIHCTTVIYVQYVYMLSTESV